MKDIITQDCSTNTITSTWNIILYLADDIGSSNSTLNIQIHVLWSRYFQTVNQSDADKVDALLDHIRTSGQYDGLVCSLIETGQGDVVTSVLGEDPTSFRARSKETGIEVCLSLYLYTCQS